MNEKKWFIFVISFYILIIAVTGALTGIIDPYFHYHAPINGTAYHLDNAYYRNDGISRHFSYNAMIIGTSMTQNFKTSEANNLFDKEFVRITYLGEGFKLINDNLRQAVNSNPDLDFVIRSVDPIWFISDENWVGYNDYPDYLYDDQLLNDVNYLFNKEIFLRDVVPELFSSIKGSSPDTFDDYVMNEDGKNGKENVLKAYVRPEREIKAIDPAETEEYFNMLNKNLEQNVISTIAENPDITFYIFFPPYSICWWDSIHQYGTDTLLRRIHMEQYAIEKFLAYDNVHLFSFSNNFDLICNLDYYIDEIHYTPEINSQILIWMKEGAYELTINNYMDYINAIAQFYTSYDYDQVFNI